jgi:hypothetical protein
LQWKLDPGYDNIRMGISSINGAVINSAQLNVSQKTSFVSQAINYMISEAAKPMELGSMILFMDIFRLADRQVELQGLLSDDKCWLFIQRALSNVPLAILYKQVGKKPCLHQEWIYSMSLFLLYADPSVWPTWEHRLFKQYLDSSVETSSEFAFSLLHVLCRYGMLLKL